MESQEHVSGEAGVSTPEHPPKENLVRAIMPGFALEERGENNTPTLYGHFARFNEWTEINSVWEGRFMERIAPGAFSKTIGENRHNIKVLYDHGHDPSIGNKPLGSITDLREDSEGASYEVSLFDASYVNDLLPALRSGQLGASFRFKVMREDLDKKPERSEHNPNGLPERTILEARVAEFGPVTFPAYEGATAGVRSLTDDFIIARLIGSPDLLRDLLSKTHFAPSTETPPVEAPQTTERRETTKQFTSREEYLSWLSSR